MSDSVEPVLANLGEYFPGLVPTLVADLWTLVLERAFDITVVNLEGHLFAAGSFVLRTQTAPAMTPEDSVNVWRSEVEPELAARSAAIEASMEHSAPVERLDALIRAWVDFFDVYFLNAAAPSIEQARSLAQSDTRLAARGARVRRRTELLAEIAKITRPASRYERAMENYLQEFGAYSEHPELLHLPYPREDRSLVEAELALVGGAGRGTSKASRPTTAEGALVVLLKIAEDDNYYKYEACFAASRCLRQLAETAVAAQTIPTVDDVWHLHVDALRGALSGTPQLDQRRTAARDEPRHDRQPDLDALHGVPVVAGEARGQAWRTTSAGDPPTHVVLITDGLGSVYAGALLPYAEGLVARQGSETSHCALIARELGRPVVVVGDQVDVIGDGDVVTFMGDGRLRIERSEGMR